MGLESKVQKSLRTPLNTAIDSLNDDNPNNDAAVCRKLSAFINEVNAREANGQLTAAQADQLGSQRTPLGPASVMRSRRSPLLRNLAGRFSMAPQGL